MIGIILTCAVNPRTNISFLKQTDPVQRLDYYIRSIRQWISDIDVIRYQVPIVIVDNSNWQFAKLRQIIQDEKLQNRVEILSFLEPENDSKEKGYYECLSIQWAIKNSVLLQSCDFVVKVTGRYYVPTLIDNIHTLLATNKQKQIDCIRQHKDFRCEIVGFRKDLSIRLFDSFGISPRYILEKALRERTFGYRSINLPELRIEPTKNGGFDTIVTSL